MATPWRSEEERKECLEKQKIQIPLTKRYKSAGDILEKLILQKEWMLEDAIEFLYSIKDADVAEVRYGEWIKTPFISGLLKRAVKNEFVFTCSVCGFDSICVSDYCRNCGAKMTNAGTEISKEGNESVDK